MKEISTRHADEIPNGPRMPFPKAFEEASSIAIGRGAFVKNNTEGAADERNYRQGCVLPPDGCLKSFCIQTFNHIHPYTYIDSKGIEIVFAGQVVHWFVKIWN